MRDKVVRRENVLWINGEGEGQAKRMNRGESVRALRRVCALMSLSFVCAFILFAAIPVSAHSTIHKAESNHQFTLEIYGNANEDDTIDMRDVTYIKLVIFGKKPETEFCDANYDGRVSMLDVVQTKLIIVGKEAKLTIVDSADRIVTVNKPIKRAFISSHHVEILRSIDVDLKDIMVGATTLDPFFFPEFRDVPQVPVIKGGKVEDTEAVLNLDPDVVIFLNVDPDQRIVYEAAGVTVIVLGVNLLENYALGTRMLGYIFDKEEEAEEFIDWFEGILNLIEEVVKEIPEEDKPKVYAEGPETYYTSSLYAVELAGGKNIFSDESGYVAVNPEAVVARNPDIIVKGVLSITGPRGREIGGYGVDAGDTAEFEEIWEEIMNRPELQGVTAVREKEVYIISHHFVSWRTASARPFLQVVYFAKWFHPTLFEDLDPKAVHQEYLTEFQGLDIDLDEKGVFVYHPELHPGGS